MAKGRLERIYAHAPAGVQNLMMSVYALYLQHQRYGGPAPRYFAELTANEALDEVEIRSLVLDRLRERAVVALSRVPAYASLRDRLDDARRARTPEEILDLFPILTKDEIRLNAESYIPAGLSGRLMLGKTSGTTGTPLRLYRTLDGVRRNFAFFSRVRRWRNLTHWSRTSTMMSRVLIPFEQTNPPFWRNSWWTGNQQMSAFHLTPEYLPHMARAVVRHRPEQIVCFPSSGALIARTMLDLGLKLDTARATFTTAETLTAVEREIMESAFGCPIADQYGSSEWTLWISQCERGTYHVHPEYGYLEIVDEQGRRLDRGEGRAIATGFINEAMVLMRYDTGDRMTVDGRSCACGRAFPALASLEGRVDDVVVTPDGRSIARLDGIFKGLRGIVECQVVQTLETKVEARLVADVEWNDATREVILAGFRERLGTGMTCEIVLAPSIPRTSSGKFRAVVGLSRGPAAAGE